MAKSPTPYLALQLPVPGSKEPFRVDDVVEWFTVLDAKHQSTDGAITALDGRLDKLELLGRGTTAQRDAQFGIPADATARAALANKAAIWFNTDKGYEEWYYATTGDAGAPAWRVATAGGWYPATGTVMMHLTFATDSQNFSGEPSLGAATRAYTEVYDPHALHDPATTPERWVPKVGGRYEVVIDAYWSASGSGDRLISIMKNGANRVGGTSTNTTVGSSPMSGQVYESFNGTTDYAYATVYSSTGVAMVLTGDLVLKYHRPL